MSLVQVSNLTKVFQRRRSEAPFTAVDDVSFTLDRGKTLAIVGESGAGKSTTGRMVARLIEPTSGSIEIGGVDLLALSKTALRKQRRHIQMIFQDPFSSLDPSMTIGRALREPLTIHFELSADEQDQRSVELLQRVGLSSHVLDRHPQEMSGGQLQRVAIARALSVEPDLIICDEPVAALDVSIRSQILNLLLDLQDETGVSYLFITHDLSTVGAFAHDILVMRYGHVVERGPVQQVFEQPAEAYTRELLESVPNPIPPSVRTAMRAAPS